MIEKPIEFNSLVMNDQADANPLVDFWIPIHSVDGLWGDDISYESYPVPCGIGERSGEVLRRGKTVTLSGEVIGLNLAQLRNGQRALAQAMWDLQPHKLKFTLWPDNFQIYLTCRVYQPLVMGEEVQGSTWHKRAFTVALRADNPRTYKVSDDSLYPSWQT